MLNVTPGAPATAIEFWREVDEIQAKMTETGATGVCRIVPPRGWVRATRAAVDAIEDRLASNTDVIPQVLDFKEKFGGARFHIQCTGVPLEDITSVLTAITERICMLTGAFAEKRFHGGWLAPLSDEAIRATRKGGRYELDVLLYPKKSTAVPLV